MSTNNTKTNTTSYATKATLAQLGIIAFVGIGYMLLGKPPLIETISENVAKPTIAAAAKILAPIGKVNIIETSEAATIRSGEEVYTATCSVCHENGIAEAPYLEDKADWEARYQMVLLP